MAGQSEPKPVSFGFEQQMNAADWTAFFGWYEARCLLGKRADSVRETPLLPSQIRSAETEQIKRAA